MKWWTFGEGFSWSQFVLDEGGREERRRASHSPSNKSTIILQNRGILATFSSKLSDFIYMAKIYEASSLP